MNAELDDEGTKFLRGLYTAILAELPKVALTNDKEIVRKTHAYISRLTEIWETDVMGKGKTAPAKPGLAKPKKQAPLSYPSGGASSFHSFSV